MLSLEQIVQRNPYFPWLHKLFHSRPNATPICLTTGLGPNGAQTVLVQQPDEFDSELGPDGDTTFDTSTTSMQGLLDQISAETQWREQQDLEPVPPSATSTSVSTPVRGGTPAAAKGKGKAESTQRAPKTSVFSANRPRKNQRKGIEELLAGNLECVFLIIYCII